MRKRPSSLLATLLSRLTGKRSPVAVKVASKFQAIAIYRGAQACEMAKKFCEHRFLVRDAPPLPLLNCSMPHACECRYLKFKDRRAGSRRLVDFRSSTRASAQSERRNYKGRRQSD